MPTTPSISHQELVAAVAATRDLELASWVKDEDLYVLRQAPEVLLTTGTATRVIVLGASIPLSFLVVRLAAGELVVTSGHPQGLFKVLAEQDDAQVTGALIFALLRAEARSQELVSVDRLEHTKEGWSAHLTLQDAQAGKVLWELSLSPNNSTLLETTP